VGAAVEWDTGVARYAGEAAVYDETSKWGCVISWHGLQELSCRHQTGMPLLWRT